MIRANDVRVGLEDRDAVRHVVEVDAPWGGVLDAQHADFRGCWKTQRRGIRQSSSMSGLRPTALVVDQQYLAVVLKMNHNRRMVHDVLLTPTGMNDAV